MSTGESRHRAREMAEIADRLHRLESHFLRLKHRRRRLGMGALLIVGAILTMGQVTVQDASVQVHENPDDGAAGSDSYLLELIGRVTGPADRHMILQNRAESGSDDYRLSFRNHGSTDELMSVDDDGGLTIGDLDGGLSGTLVLLDSDVSSPESVTVVPPSGANLASSYTLTLPEDDGTSGDFLRSDGSGTLSWSGTISQVSATGDVTTSSTSDTLLTTMTTTPGAGDYMVWFSGSAESTATTHVYISLYVGGTQVAHTEREFYSESSIDSTSFPIALQAYVTSVGASDAIEIRWRLESGSDTGTFHERTLTVMKR